MAKSCSNLYYKTWPPSPISSITLHLEIATPTKWYFCLNCKRRNVESSNIK